MLALGVPSSSGNGYRGRSNTTVLRLCVDCSVTVAYSVIQQSTTTDDYEEPGSLYTKQAVTLSYRAKLKHKNHKQYILKLNYYLLTIKQAASKKWINYCKHSFKQ
jgi:hypothetical protein